MDKAICGAARRSARGPSRRAPAAEAIFAVSPASPQQLRGGFVGLLVAAFQQQEDGRIAPEQPPRQLPPRAANRSSRRYPPPAAARTTAARPVAVGRHHQKPGQGRAPAGGFHGGYRSFAALSFAAGLAGSGQVDQLDADVRRRGLFPAELLQRLGQLLRLRRQRTAVEDHELVGIGAEAFQGIAEDGHGARPNRAPRRTEQNRRQAQARARSGAGQQETLCRNCVFASATARGVLTLAIPAGTPRRQDDNCDPDGQNSACQALKKYTRMPLPRPVGRSCAERSASRALEYNGGIGKFIPGRRQLSAPRSDSMDSCPRK